MVNGAGGGYCRGNVDVLATGIKVLHVVEFVLLFFV